MESVPEFGLMLTLPAEYRNVAYYGMGPGETYSDFTSGAHMGLFGFDAHTALQPYFNPQESGARTGVQAAAVTDAAGFGPVSYTHLDVYKRQPLRYTKR